MSEPMEIDTPTPGPEAPPIPAHIDEMAEEDYAQIMTLPISKIKRIFKMDTDYTMASQLAVYATGVATELFVQYLTEQATVLAKMDKRKKVAYKDVAQAVATHDNLQFLHDTVPKTQILGNLINQKSIRAENLPVEEEALGAEDPEVTPVPQPSAPALAPGQQRLPFAPVSPAPAAQPFKKAGLSDIMG